MLPSKGTIQLWVLSVSLSKKTKHGKEKAKAKKDILKLKYSVIPEIVKLTLSMGNTDTSTQLIQQTASLL